MSLQERVESSDWGRGLLSAFIGITVATVLIQQLPNSHVRVELTRLAGPYANATGLDQDWAVFAPDPRRSSIELEARIRYEDGSTAVWRPPRSNDFVGVYWDYRWLKLVEHVNPDTGVPLWRGVAVYAARQKRRDTPIVSVDLVRRWSDLLPPGRDGPSEAPWREFKFYSLPEPLVRAVNVEERS